VARHGGLHRLAHDALELVRLLLALPTVTPLTLQPTAHVTRLRALVNALVYSVCTDHGCMTHTHARARAQTVAVARIDGGRDLPARTASAARRASPSPRLWA
jgi:hypothetical protein